MLSFYKNPNGRKYCKHKSYQRMEEEMVHAYRMQNNKHQNRQIIHLVLNFDMCGPIRMLVLLFSEDINTGIVVERLTDFLERLPVIIRHNIYFQP